MKLRVILSLLLSFSCLVAYAQTSSTAKFAFSDYPPSSTLQNGTPVGIDVDIVTAALKTQGIQADYVMFPWNRCLQMLDNKEVDGVFIMAYSKEREDKYSLSTSLRARGSVVVARADLKKTIATLADLKGLTVGNGQGYSVSSDFDAATKDGSFTLDAVATTGDVYEILLKKLSAGRDDVAVIDISVVSPLVKKLGLGNSVKITGLSYPKASHVGFVKGNAYWAPFEKGYAKIKASGELDRILQKWNVN